jgi:hypothetical protein
MISLTNDLIHKESFLEQDFFDKFMRLISACETYDKDETITMINSLFGIRQMIIDIYRFIERGQEISKNDRYNEFIDLVKDQLRLILHDLYVLKYEKKNNLEIILKENRNIDEEWKQLLKDTREYRESLNDF